jgi:nucleolar protein 56
LVEKHETYTRLVNNLGYKESFTLDNLEKEGIPKDRAQLIAKAAESSMGADVSEKDLTQIQELSKSCAKQYELRKNMENYLERTMEELAPNVRAVAGALLGARFIALLAASKTLPCTSKHYPSFRCRESLIPFTKNWCTTTQTRLNLQHTLLHDAKRWQRGKIARVIAGKLSIAARADAFGGKLHCGPTQKRN